MTRSRRLAQLDDERGSIAPLALIFVVLAVGVMLVIAASANLYLERKQLYALADAAALAATGAFDVDEVAVTDSGIRAQLDPDLAREKAIDYLNAFSDHAQSVEVLEVTVDGDRVTVHLRTTWLAPFGAEWLTQHVPIEVIASSRVLFE